MVNELAAPDRILELLQDGYANYVIQKAIDSDHPAVFTLVKNIQQHTSALSRTPYGKKIYTKIQNMTRGSVEGP